MLKPTLCETFAWTYTLTWLDFIPCFTSFVSLPVSLENISLIHYLPTHFCLRDCILGTRPKIVPPSYKVGKEVNACSFQFPERELIEVSTVISASAQWKEIWWLRAKWHGFSYRTVNKDQEDGRQDCTGMGSLGKVTSLPGKKLREPDQNTMLKEALGLVLTGVIIWGESIVQ